MVRSLRMRLAAAIVATAAGAETAAAQDRTVQEEGERPFARVEIGAAYSYEFVSGRVTTLTLAEKTADGSLWRVDEGRGADAREIGALRYDADGRVTAYLRPDGSPIETYAPHNCERVTGLCAYQVTSGGETLTERRIGGVDDESWSFSIFVDRDGSPKLEKVGTVTYDADGVVVDELWIEGETGEEGGARRID